MPDKKIPSIVVTDRSQTPTVLNLESGQEQKIVIKQKAYTLPTYTADFGTESDFWSVLLSQAQELVQPISAQVEALLVAATAASYQAGKTAALSVGNFLTSDLKQKIVQAMRGNVAFAEKSAKDCYEIWLAGYMAVDASGNRTPKSGAIKALEIAKSIGDFSEDEF